MIEKNQFWEVKMMFLRIFILAGILSPLFLSGLEVMPKKAVILYEEPKYVALKSFAAYELQHHLEKVTGVKIPVRASRKVQKGEYPFFVGIRPESDKTPFKPEEGRFLVTPQGTYIYGHDRRGLMRGCYPDKSDATTHFRAVTGTYFGMLEFLEQQFGFRWVEPGERGYVFRPSKTLDMKVAKGSWDPGRLVMRWLRPGYLNDYKFYSRRYADLVSPGLRFSEKEFKKQQDDERVWLKRQRMGRSLGIFYGHAFTKWRERFLKTHPDYLAQDGKGKVRPTVPGWPRHFLLCVSNPGVHQQIMADFRRSPGDTMNICENDGGLFCLCARCKAWGEGVPDGKRRRIYTDRYMKFANIMQGLLTKEFPGRSAVFYIYSDYRFPPLQEKVDPNLILGFVPELMEQAQVDGMYKAWRKAGAGKIFLRPNDHHFNTGLPMGFEKQIYDNFKLGLDNGIIGTDYDTLHNFWPATGIADYILARAHVRPDWTFEQLENDYLTAFGKAAPEIKAYYRYWRNEIWEKRLLPNRQQILERGRFGNYRRGLVWDLPKYYKLSDIDATDKLLKKALKKELTKAERARVEALVLANQHLRLIHGAISARRADVKLAFARKLHEFRCANKNKLHFDWAKLVALEKRFGDLTGNDLAVSFKGKKAISALPVYWNFKDDPKNVGEKEAWHKLNIIVTRDKWETIYVNQAWENQTSTRVPKALKQRMKNYNGIGYYALGIKVPAQWKGKGRIKVFFNAVDESAWVYLNGKYCGKRIFREGSDDWKTPFEIDITDAVNWNQSHQHLVVRVRDLNGQGGIWKSVFLTLE